MAFGTGSAVANRAVDAVMGPRQVEHVHNNSNDGGDQQPQQQQYDSQPQQTYGAPQQQQQQQSMACDRETFDFNQCVKDNGGDMNSCKFYFEQLTQCQQDSSDRRF